MANSTEPYTDPALMDRDRADRGNVNMDRETLDLIEAVMAFYHRTYGIRLSRPQAVAFIAKSFLNTYSESKDSRVELERLRAARRTAEQVAESA